MQLSGPPPDARQPSRQRKDGTTTAIDLSDPLLASGVTMNESGSNSKHCRDCGELVGDYWLTVGYATTAGHQPTRCYPCMKTFQVLKDRKRRGAVIGDTRRCTTCSAEFIAMKTESTQCPAHVNTSWARRNRLRAKLERASDPPRAVERDGLT